MSTLSSLPLCVREIARRYVATLTTRQADTDLASLFAPKVTVFHNWDQKPIQLPASILAAAMARKISLCFERVTDYNNTIDMLHIAPSGITVGITARGVYPDGAPLFISRSVVLSVNEDGLIDRVDNYGDHGQSQLLDRLIPHKDILTAAAAAQ